MRLVPLNRDRARAFVAEHHRHSRPPVGDVMRVGLEHDGELVGVAIAGRPVARHLDDGVTLEVLRVCTIEGNPNACSRLYSALARAAAALGYERVVTYTLESEWGSSLRAAGFTIDENGVDHRRVRYWRRNNRHRYHENLLGERIDDGPGEDRVRWSRQLS